jgi:hypothetical protein
MIFGKCHKSHPMELDHGKEAARLTPTAWRRNQKSQCQGHREINEIF